MRRLLAVSILALLAASCAGRAARRDAPARTCLVLSVAGPRGFAMAGALDALRARGERFDCVYGNSMGALVGALYASAPDADLPGRYEGFLVSARADAVAAAGWARRLLAEVFGVRGSGRLNLAVFERSLDHWVDGVRIEQLPIPFATSHSVIDDRGADLEIETRGPLAAAVSRSLAHPGFFELGDASALRVVDPGLDRAARVPVADACATFGPADLVVVNLTGTPAPAAPPGCTVREIAVGPIPPGMSDLSGRREDEDALVGLGREAVERGPARP